MLRYEDTGLPCPARGEYEMSPATSNVRKPILRGRTRNTLTDEYATMRGSITMTFSAGEMASWHHFWAALDHGVDWFLMHLTIYDAEAEYPVHARGAFQAQNLPGNIWKVTLPVEVIVQ